MCNETGHLTPHTYPYIRDKHFERLIVAKIDEFIAAVAKTCESGLAMRFPTKSVSQADQLIAVNLPQPVESTDGYIPSVTSHAILWITVWHLVMAELNPSLPLSNVPHARNGLASQVRLEDGYEFRSESKLQRLHIPLRENVLQEHIQACLLLWFEVRRHFDDRELHFAGVGSE